MIKLRDLIDDVMKEAKGTDPFPDDQTDQDPNLEEGARACHTCRWFIKDLSKCVLLKPPEVVAQGICNQWSGGGPASSDKLYPHQSIEKRDADYIDDYRKHHFNLGDPGE